MAPSTNRSANSLALSDYSPTMMRDGYRLSYNDCPSRKNSGEKTMFLVPSRPLTSFVN